MFLEDGNWQDADTYCEKVLDLDPECGEAYLGKLMAELNVRTRQQLADCKKPFDDRENFAKVIRFGDEKTEADIRGYIAHINERNENERLQNLYDKEGVSMKKPEKCVSPEQNSLKKRNSSQQSSSRLFARLSYF